MHSTVAGQLGITKGEIRPDLEGKGPPWACSCRVPARGRDTVGRGGRASLSGIGRVNKRLCCCFQDRFWDQASWVWGGRQGLQPERWGLRAACPSGKVTGMGNRPLLPGISGLSQWPSYRSKNRLWGRARFG